MSRAILSLAVLGCALSSLAEAAVTYPYSASIATETATVRSGPADTYYATVRLERGAEVKVYRATDDGWLAIRPTSADFSWVDSRFLRNQANGMVEVSDGEAVAWIGTTGAAPANYKWQVKLRPGERLDFLGRRSMSALAEDPTSDFVKISPPSGEFRWIEARHVQQRAKSKIALVSHQQDTTLSGSDSASGLKWRRVKRSDTSAHRVATRISRDRPQPLSRKAAPQPVVAAGDESSPTAKRNLPVDPSWETTRLSLELADMATKPSEQWQFKPLRDRAVQIVQDHSDALERGKARLLIERIDEFRFLKQRRELTFAGKPAKLDVAAIETRPGKKDKPSESLLSLSELTAPVLAETNEAVGSGVAPASFDEASPYAAKGWLSQVITRSRGVPPYALVDSNNKILCFVTPYPGFNLHRYLKTEIGVIGPRSTYGAKGTPHVRARRAVNLARHRAQLKQ